MNTNVTVCIVVLAFFCIKGNRIFCAAQGRLVDPPSRASMWRYGFLNPVDFKDDQQNCGGFHVQWRIHGGRCGVCGDSWDFAPPRPHEARGRFGKRGVIVRNYTQEQEVQFTSELTESLTSGYMQYHLCPRNSTKDPETQGCFSHVLQTESGETDFPVNVTESPKKVNHILTLPPDLSCAACILQWRYVSRDSTGRQEIRACADISIMAAVTTTTIKPVSFTSSPYPQSIDNPIVTLRSETSSTSLASQATTAKSGVETTTERRETPAPKKSGGENCSACVGDVGANNAFYVVTCVTMILLRV